MGPGMKKAHIRTIRRPRQKRARQTVEAILEAVTRILKRHGAGAVTTNRIAETAGVSIGSLYQYFRDRRAILLALRDRHVAEMAGLVERALLASAGGDLEETLRGLLEAMVEAHARDHELYTLLLLELPQDAAGDDGLDQRLGQALRLALAAHGAEMDEARDVERLVFVLRALLESLAHAVALRRPPGVSRQAALDEAARVLRSYVGSYARRPRRRTVRRAATPSSTQSSPRAKTASNGGWVASRMTRSRAGKRPVASNRRR